MCICQPREDKPGVPNLVPRLSFLVYKMEWVRVPPSWPVMRKVCCTVNTPDSQLCCMTAVQGSRPFSQFRGVVRKLRGLGVGGSKD